MDECRLLVMLHRALPTRGHGCVEKQSLSVHPSVSLDASPLLWRYWATIRISAIAQKLSGRVRERCASACSSPVAAFML